MTLREWRYAAGLTQQQLARRAQVSRSSLSAIENGHRAPSAGFAGKICRALSREFGCAIHTWHVFPQRFNRVLVTVRRPLDHKKAAALRLQAKDLDF